MDRKYNFGILILIAITALSIVSYRYIYMTRFECPKFTLSEIAEARKIIVGLEIELWECNLGISIIEEDTEAAFQLLIGNPMKLTEDQNQKVKIFALYRQYRQYREWILESNDSLERDDLDKEAIEESVDLKSRIARKVAQLSRRPETPFEEITPEVVAEALKELKNESKDFELKIRELREKYGI